MFDVLKLNEACKEQHEAVLQKGFEPQPVATKIMLIVSELSEALEADRKNRHTNMELAEKDFPCALIHPEGYCVGFVCRDTNEPIDALKAQAMCKHAFEKHIKDTFEDEIADAFLRLMDLCGEYGIDIERHIKLKAEYNKSRPIKHGKAY